MQLFKYVEPARVDVLINETIAFTPPERFKDPFEFRPIVAPGSRVRLKQNLKDAAKQEFKESPDFYKKFSRKERREKERKAVNEALRQVRSGEAGHSEKIQDSIVNEASKSFGILCLCSKQDENLMWYHYADGHRGFVMEFHTQHEDFLKLGKPTEVIYSDTPAILDLDKPNNDLSRIKPMYLKYEAEYRIIAPLPVSTPHKTPDGLPLYLAKLPRTCIKAVYLGHRMEKAWREKLLKAISSASIAKFEVVPNRNDFKFSYREIK